MEISKQGQQTQKKFSTKRQQQPHEQRNLQTECSGLRQKSNRR